MSVPRFLFLATGRPGGKRDAAAASDFLWRLVAGNNRLLGRGPGTYDSEVLCREAVKRLVANLGRASPGQAPLSRPGHWSWALTLRTTDALPLVLAVSARSYERPRESRYSLEHFLAAAPVAVVASTVVVRPRARPLVRTDLLLPVIPNQGQARTSPNGKQASPGPVAAGPGLAHLSYEPVLADRGWPRTDSSLPPE